MAKESTTNMLMHAEVALKLAIRNLEAAFRAESRGMEYCSVGPGMGDRHEELRRSRKTITRALNLTRSALEELL